MGIKDMEPDDFVLVATLCGNLCIFTFTMLIFRWFRNTRGDKKVHLQKLQDIKNNEIQAIMEVDDMANQKITKDKKDK